MKLKSVFFFLDTLKKWSQSKGGDETTAGELSHEGMNDQDWYQVDHHIQKIRQHTNN